MQAPEFSLTTNAAVTAGYRLWAARCASLPWAKRYLIEGNHDARLANMVVRNAAAALRIRPGDAPGHWPVLSVPNLLRLDELGVTYVGGYPAGEVLLSTSFVAHHGRTVNSSGSTAAKVVQSAQQCTVFGHIHRLEVQPSVIRDPSTGGWRRIWAASAGTLARVDGHVPSYGSAEDAFGAPVPTWHENWTQGMLLVEYAADGSWVGWPEIIEIDHGRATWRGQEFTSDGDVPWRIDSLADIRPGLAEAADKHNSRSRKAR